MANNSKPSFHRQESWRLRRVKENWRRPRGVTSRMRKEKSGWPAKVKAGYGKKASERGLHPRGLIERLVKHESDLEGLDPKRHIVRLSSRLGERRRLILLDRVKALNVHVANPGKEEARPVAEEEAPAKPPALEEQASVEETEHPEGEEETVEAKATSDAGEDKQQRVRSTREAEEPEEESSLEESEN